MVGLGAIVTHLIELRFYILVPQALTPRLRRGSKRGCLRSIMGSTEGGSRCIVQQHSLMAKHIQSKLNLEYNDTTHIS
jgi:hypothetical protein